MKFSNVIDPEGHEVLILFDLQQASRFTYWEPETLSLIVEEGKTKIMQDEGDYEIKAIFIEVIDGIRMPSSELKFNLTIGYYSQIDDEPEIVKPKNIPTVWIQEMLMNGKMRISFSRPLNFPTNLRNSLWLKAIPGEKTNKNHTNFDFLIDRASDS